MRITRLQYELNVIFIFVLCSVLLSATAYRYVTGQEPCPLCFLQRLGMLGMMVGCMLNLRFGLNMMHYGVVLLFACFGAFVSLRQIALHVCPGFSTFGTPVLGLSLYSWALVVFASSILATALLLFLYGFNKDKNQIHPLKGSWPQFTFLVAFAVSSYEIVCSLLTCGLTACSG